MVGRCIETRTYYYYTENSFSELAIVLEREIDTGFVCYFILFCFVSYGASMCILSYSALINILSTFGLYITLEIYGICACSGKSGIKGEERGG